MGIKKPTMKCVKSTGNWAKWKSWYWQHRMWNSQQKDCEIKGNWPVGYKLSSPHALPHAHAPAGDVHDLRLCNSISSSPRDETSVTFFKKRAEVHAGRAAELLKTGMIWQHLRIEQVWPVKVWGWVTEIKKIDVLFVICYDCLLYFLLST